FFEVPDIGRILDIPAFWDIYYEHCSYFSPGSLARLFRRAGFDVSALRLDYSNQYVLIEAAPGESSGSALESEESVAELHERVQRFKARVEQQLGQWRDRLTQMKAESKRVAIWGGGSKAVGFLTSFADLSLVEFVVDINPNMAGNFIPGIGCQYVRPDFLAD